MTNILENNKNYILGGRYVKHDNVLYLSYSASYIEFWFTGKKVTAVMTADCICEAPNLDAWAAVFVDDEFEPVKRFSLKKGEHTYDIYESDEVKSVKIRIMKYSEVAFSSFGIKSINIDGEINEVKPSGKKLIEIVGDSITCGYGNEAFVDEGVFDTAKQNPWKAYSCRLARKLDMDMQLVSWSGNGVISHYMDKTADEPRRDNFLLPALYPYSDCEIERRLLNREMDKEKFTKWDYSSSNTPEEGKKPSLIVINLGTNDSSYTCRDEKKSKFFEDTYVEFLSTIHAINPQANILCVLGLMDQCLTTQVANAVERFNAIRASKVDDNKASRIEFLELKLQEEDDGFATDYHPTMISHEKAACEIYDYVVSNNLI